MMPNVWKSGKLCVCERERERKKVYNDISWNHCSHFSCLHHCFLASFPFYLFIHHLLLYFHSLSLTHTERRNIPYLSFVSSSSFSLLPSSSSYVTPLDIIRNGWIDSQHYLGYIMHIWMAQNEVLLHVCGMPSQRRCYVDNEYINPTLCDFSHVKVHRRNTYIRNTYCLSLFLRNWNTYSRGWYQLWVDISLVSKSREHSMF